VPTSARVLDVETPKGLARLHVTSPRGRPSGLLVLGHGAGGGIEAPDLATVAVTVRDAGWRVALVEQPWRVAGRRVAPAPAALDAAWVPVLAALAGQIPTPGPLIVGGRSAGARVACRTASAVGASGVVCLAFPLHPPGRPERSRLEELAGCGLPALVVQGRKDAFGTAEELAALAPDGVTVAVVEGDHGLKAGAGAAADAVARWLSQLPTPTTA
jgi:predicted alpha/beta-hydrolase family hydrolase